jgi:hypothetical protein
MKTKELAYVGFLMFFASHILFAGDYKKEIPVEEAMKVYCATWLVETGLVLHKIVYNTDGTYGYYYKDAEKPNYSGTFKIEKSWEDSEGNTWLIVKLSYPGGPWSLNKISKDRNVRERINRSIQDNLPADLDPKDGSYARFILHKNE